MIPAPAPKASTAAPAPMAAGSVLKAGTIVPLKLADAAKGKKLGVGQRVPLAVASDLRVGSNIVIPAGAAAEGEITALEGKTVAAKVLKLMASATPPCGPVGPPGWYAGSTTVESAGTSGSATVASGSYRWWRPPLCGRPPVCG